MTEIASEDKVVENPDGEQCSKDVMKEEEKETKSEEEEKLGGPQFVPRLYLQRYYFVQQMLIKHKAEKIVDFGSAECRISRYLVNIPTAREITLVDIDRTTLEMSKWCIRPMTCDYICRREKPLDVRIFEGSVTEFDSMLKNYDAVSMVELIEHLHPDVLDAAVAMIFGHLTPRIVIMTTPNAEFNVLFPGFSGFRHWDHKFEWTRFEFQSWCKAIAEKYEYSLDYSGVGQPPEEFGHLGCCSQAAVFHRNYSSKVIPEAVSSSECYSLVAECSYPFKAAEERSKDPLLSEIKFQLRQFQTDTQYEDYDCNCLVPVSTLLGFKKIKSEFTEDSFRDYLRNHGYRLSEDDATIILPAIYRQSDYDIEDDHDYYSLNSETNSNTDSVSLASESHTDRDNLVHENRTVENEIEYWD